VVHVPLLNRAFGTTPLSAGDWVRCFAMASLVLWADELKKLLMRWLPRRR
jgi:P-type Ca2+ transporter type 2C